MSRYATTDFIQAMVNDKPIEASGIFDDLMQDRLDQIVTDCAEDITKNLFNQEVDEETDLDEDQLDELKKSTVSKYMKKAADEHDSHGALSKDYKSKAKLYKKLEKQYNSDNVLSKDSENNSKAHGDRAKKRLSGIKNAMKRLTKEEAEGNQ